MKNKYLVLFTFLMLFSQPVFAAYVPNNITASSPDIVISPSGCTNAPCTVGTTDLINAQGTTSPYTVLSTDMGKTVTHSKSTAVAETLPQAGTTGFGAGVSYSVINLGVGTLTITPTTSTINGSTTLVLTTNQSAWVISDGTNWYAFTGAGNTGTGAATGSANTFTAVQTFSAATIQTPVALTISGAAFPTNAALGNIFYVTLNGATITATNPTNAVDGETITYEITQPASAGPDVISWGANFDFGASGSPTLSTSNNKIDLVGFRYSARNSKWNYLGSQLGN